MNFHASLWTLTICVLSTTASSQTCPIAIEINSAPLPESGGVAALSDSPDAPFAAFSGRYYFQARTVLSGSEMYSTDGTTAGTTLTADINPLGGSNPRGFTALGSKLFFFADDGVHGQELWTLDSSGGAPQMVKDLGPGALGGTKDSGYSSIGNRFVYRGLTGGSNRQVWISDGTEAGTMALSSPSITNNDPRFFTQGPAGNLVFYSDSLSHGSEPMVTDGTVMGTFELKDIRPGLAGSHPTQFVSAIGKTFFLADDGMVGQEVWVTDGTSAGTTLLKDIKQGPLGLSSSFQYSAVFGGDFYFAANDGVNGFELWKTDGTTAGTTMVMDLVPGLASSSPKDMLVVGNELFISIDNGHFDVPGHTGRELYKLDLGGQLTLVKDISPGYASGLPFGNARFTEVAGKLCFVAHGPQQVDQLWLSDGTAAGTQAVTFNLVGELVKPAQLTPLPGNVLLFGAEHSSVGREIWRAELSGSGTQLLADIDSGTYSEGSHPNKLSTPDGKRLLTFARSDSDYNLWSIDPIGSTPTLLADVAFDTFSGSTDTFKHLWLGDRPATLFPGWKFPFGVEPWITDGTPAGTSMLKNISGGGYSDPAGFMTIGDLAVFSAIPDTSGKAKLYSTDGTAAGTRVLKNVRPAVVDYESDGTAIVFTRFENKLYFRGADNLSDGGFELWSTDGTASGTQLVMDINPGFSGSSPSRLFAHNGRLFFNAYVNGIGYELWSTDGANTTLVADLTPGAFGLGPHDMLELNDKLYFWSEDVLYTTDGTAMGTVPSNADGIGTSFLRPGVQIGNELFFAGTTDATGTELWKSDGTELGTMLVIENAPGPVSSNPENLIAANGGLYFTLFDAAVGNELWFSDGTTAGTHLVCDLMPGTESSSPTNLTLADGKLFFIAESHLSGREVFYLPAAGPYVHNLGPDVGNAKLTSTPPGLGSSTTIACEGIPAGGVSVLVMSLPIAAPTTFQAAYNYASWIDPGSASPIALFLGTAWSFTAQIPLTPSLIGFQFNLQNFALVGASFPAETSNGLSIVIGH